MIIGHLSRVKENIEKFGHNAKVLVITEVLFMPTAWVFFYRPILLKAIGISDIEIGLLFSILSLSSAFFPLLGSMLVSKLGKKKAFVLCDTLGWLSSVTLLLFARNFFLVLLAMILEGIAWTTASVWESLLVEDTSPEHRAKVYSSISIVWTISSLLTPIAGTVINYLGTETGIRVLLLISVISLVVMFFLRWNLLEENYLNDPPDCNGQISLKKYKEALKVLNDNKLILTLILTSVFGSIFYYTSTTYVPIFLVDKSGLGLSASLASIVPFISSIITLYLLIYYVPKLNGKEEFLSSLIIGLVSSSISSIVLFVSEGNTIILAVFYALFSSFYSGVSYSVQRTLLHNEIENVNPSVRIEILSINYVVVSFASVVIPSFLGYLYSLNSKLVFFISSIATAIGSLMLFMVRKSEDFMI